MTRPLPQVCPTPLRVVNHDFHREIATQQARVPYVLMFRYSLFRYPFDGPRWITLCDGLLGIHAGRFEIFQNLLPKKLGEFFRLGHRKAVRIEMKTNGHLTII